MMVFNQRTNEDSDLKFETKLDGDLQQLVHLSSSTYRDNGSGTIINLDQAVDEMSGKAVREALEALHTEQKRVRYLLKRLSDTSYKIEQHFKAPISPNYRGAGSSDDVLDLDD